MGSSQSSDEDAQRRLEALHEANKRTKHNCVLTNVVCASQSTPKFLPTHFGEYRVNLDEFFPKSHVISLPQLVLDGNNGTPNGLESLFATERMRDNLCTYLTDFHDIKLAGLYAKSPSSASFAARQYKESTLATLFRDLGGQTPSERLERLNIGLPVTTGTSSCSVCVVRGKNCSFTGEPVLGETKNAGEATHGRKQCFLHLMSHFYFARVVKGAPAESVYGFSVNGPEVEGVDFYEVTLLRIRAVKSLGEDHFYEYHTLQGTSWNDMKPLQTLIHFLTAGRTSSFDQSLRLANGKLDPERRAPCRFVLPNALWHTDTHTLADGNLVLSGTSSIVFQGSLTGLRTLVRKHVRTNDLVSEWLNRFNEDPDVPGGHYLKLTDASGLRRQYNRVVKQDRELLFTYPMPPQDKFIFMRNRGRRITEDVVFKTIAELREAFLQVWNTGMYLCEQQCNPRDTLPHNMVLHKRSLHLIDVDENFLPEIAERELPRNNAKENWLEAVRYPNYLRAKVWVYTLVQLSYSIYVLSAKLEMNAAKAVELASSRNIEGALRVIGEDLLDKQRALNVGSPRNVNPIESDLKGDLLAGVTVLMQQVPTLLGVTLPDAFEM